MLSMVRVQSSTLRMDSCTRGTFTKATDIVMAESSTQTVPSTLGNSITARGKAAAHGRDSTNLMMEIGLTIATGVMDKSATSMVRSIQGCGKQIRNMDMESYSTLPMRLTKAIFTTDSDTVRANCHCP